MANAIAVRQGNGVSGRIPIYTMRISDDSGDLAVDSFTCDNCTSLGIDFSTVGAAIIKVDWADVACGDPLTCPSPTPTWRVGDVIFAYLVSHGLSSHSIAEVPIHLIGHSRGASVNSRLAYDLGAYGIWVDHVSNLDPQPVTAVFGDFQVRSWKNILFADNSYRTDGVPPLGESIAGTYERSLNGIVIGDGYNCTTLLPISNGSAHEQVHTYYHGTILGDNDACADNVMVQSEWYDPQYPTRKTGYYFSRTGKGDRYSAEAVSGLHYRLSDSLQNNRQSVTLVGAAWPNATFKPLASYNYPANSPINLTYYYQDADSSMDVVFSLDNDTNPFNDSTNTCYKQIGSSLNNALSSTISAATTFSWTPGNADAGTWYVQIKATDAGGHVRFDYLPKPINITATAQVQSDLVIENLTVTPNTREPGSTATVAFTIRNVGLGRAYASSANIRLNSFISGVSVNDTPLVIGVDTPTLSPNGTFPVSQTVTIPQVVASGTYYVWVIVDVSNEANQSDTSDASDKAKVPITINVPAAPTAIGDYVQVFSTGTSGLRVRSPNACDAPLVGANHFDGAQGRIIEGPQPCTISGVTYTFWKIQWSDCVIGWSAQNWLKKIAPVTISCATQTLTVTASLPNAAEQGNTAGRFTITRTGGTQAALAVNYSVGGTAQNGVDYPSLSGAVIIPIGSNSVNVTVTPIDDAIGEADETVILTLSANGAYTVGTPNSATVTITDNDSLGDITGPVTWSGEVQLFGDVRILPNGALTIQPGTTVRCTPSSDNRNVGIDSGRIEIILAGGTLNASGTSGSPIVFTSDGPKFPGNWYGLRLVDGSVAMSNFVIEFAQEGLRLEDGDTRFDGYTIQNGVVRNCNNYGLRQTSTGNNGLVTLDGLVATNNPTGVYAQGWLTLNNASITRNTGTGLQCDSGTVTVNGGLVTRNSTGVSGGSGQLVMLNCNVSSNDSSGISVNDKALSLDGCVVRVNGGDGVYGFRASMQIRNCTVQSNNSSGLTLNSPYNLAVTGNTIEGNRYDGLAVSFSCNWGGSMGPDGIANNVIRRNDVGLRFSGNCAPNPLRVTSSDLYNNTSFELRNESSVPVITTDCYWGEPTSTELNQNQVNLSRIYDQRDSGSYGLVTIQNPRFSPIGGGSGGTPPTITSQPQSQTVTAGGTASFSVAASGSTPFSFQWRRNGNPISSATNATIVLLNVQTGNAGTYSVIVSNNAGSTTSAGATLTVNPAPSPLASRSITHNAGTFAITLTISPVSGAGYGFIEEALPAGFTATGMNVGGTFNAVSGKILWGPLADNQTFQLTYTLQPPGDFQGNAFLSGIAYYSGATVAVTGDSMVSLSPILTGAPSTLALTKLYGIWTVLLSGEVGRTYRLEARNALGSGAWEPLANLNITQNPRIYIDGDSVDKTQRFYRAVLVE